MTPESPILPVRSWGIFSPRPGFRRSGRRWLLREELWSGNRETLKGIFIERDGVFPHAIRRYFFGRQEQAAELQRYVFDGKRLVRLCRPAEVDAFVRAFPAA